MSHCWGNVMIPLEQFCRFVHIDPAGWAEYPIITDLGSTIRALPHTDAIGLEEIEDAEINFFAEGKLVDPLSPLLKGKSENIISITFPF